MRGLLVAGGVFLAGFALAAAPAAAQDSRNSGHGYELALLTPGSVMTGHQVELPAILSDQDASLYRRIFALQARQDWGGADALIGKLTDRSLLGQVLAQRYLSGHYHPHWPQLVSWMRAYADEPAAREIYRMARRMAPRRMPIPAPRGGFLIGTGHDQAGLSGRAFLAARRGRRLEHLVQWLLNKDAPSHALKVLEAHAARDGMTRREVDRTKAAIAASLLYAGKPDKALEIADPLAAQSGRALPLTHWTAGLAAWELKRFDLARVHFETLAEMDGVPSWDASAAAYWAARVQLVTGHPGRYTYWLEQAAQHPRTFYGLLARRQLGADTFFAWDSAPLTDVDISRLENLPAGRRALGLIQIGQDHLAERELRKLYPGADPQVVSAMLALAIRANMPSLAMRLGDLAAANDGRRHDAALYPVPQWRPEGGFQVQPALLYALMRQESGFRSDARSPVGALGLMQLMPATARTVTGFAVPRDRLERPETNIDIGQRYVAQLLNNDAVHGNLLLFAAAYNAGLGNVIHWMQRGAHDGERIADPLLFMETIPVEETRAFIERVMTNYWIYCARLNHTPNGLKALASGDWPSYRGLDSGAAVASAAP